MTVTTQASTGNLASIKLVINIIIYTFLFPYDDADTKQNKRIQLREENRNKKRFYQYTLGLNLSVNKDNTNKRDCFNEKNILYREHLVCDVEVVIHYFISSFTGPDYN